MDFTQRTDIHVIPEDIRQIVAETIAQYEQWTNKVLQPAHIERLLINVYAYREMLARKGVNEAFRQTFPQTATGVALDLCGEPLGCYRLHNRPARTTLRFSVSGTHTSIVIPKGTQVAVTDDIIFSTLTEDVITPLVSYVEIDAECNQSGPVGNGWELGRVKTLKSPLNTEHTVTVTNMDVTSGA